MQQISDTAWHYTTAIGFAGILDSRLIKPSTIDIGPHEHPVVWFSAANFEPTISEIRWDSATHPARPLRTPAEFRLYGLGLYRLGVPREGLLSYTRLLSKAKIGLIRRKLLERVARQVGSNPGLWFGCLEAVPVSAATVRFAWYDGGRWNDAAITDARRILYEQMETIRLDLKKVLGGASRSASISP